jgi:hypothetical protein
MKTTRQGKVSLRESDPLLRNRRRSEPMKQSSLEDELVDAGGYQSIEPEHGPQQDPRQEPQLYRQPQDEETPPMLEIPEEIYAVRKAALKVMKPLNNTWVSFKWC